MLRAYGADVVVGVGGGKAMDLVRAASLQHSCKVVLVPTSPATNASGSGIVVVYHENGTVNKTMAVPIFPELVLADLTVLMRAPWKMLAAGIGDAIGTAIETEAYWRTVGLDTQILEGSWQGNMTMQQVLLKHGRAAVEAAKTGILNHAYESIMPYILNTCGNQRYFRVTFLPHCFDKLFLMFEGPKKLQHGERVGYGVIGQMVQMKKPLREIYDYIDFLVDIGLPVTFEDLGLTGISTEMMREASKRLLAENKIMMSHPFAFTAEMFVVPLLAGEHVAQEYLSQIAARQKKFLMLAAPTGSMSIVGA